MDEATKQKIEYLEKRIAVLEGQVQAQPRFTEYEIGRIACDAVASAFESAHKKSSCSN